jgi:hypothetical protein
VIENLRIRLYVTLFCTAIFSLVATLAAGQSSTASSQKNAVPDKQSRPADVSGNWQVSWETRLGTNKGVLHLDQNGAKLTGTFKDLHGVSDLSGTVDQSQLTFDVQFQGPRPFSIRFRGTANADDIQGTSQAINVDDGGGAFLGHGGEIVHPEHPWTAKRVNDKPAPPNN